MVKNLLRICVLLWAPAALANQVTQVTAHDGSVRITADEAPNFTTFTIDYPPRLVIDVAGATLVDVPTNIPVAQGGVQAILALPYGTGSSAVARIIIMYDKPVQTDILTDGNSIVVKQAEAAPVLAAPAQPAPANPPRATARAHAHAAPPPPSPTPAAATPPPPRQAAATPPSPTPASQPAAPQPAAPPPPPHPGQRPPSPWWPHRRPPSLLAIPRGPPRPRERASPAPA